MGFFDGVKCLTGFHDWTVWNYTTAVACGQTRQCRRSGCGKSEQQTVHSWSPFAYLAEDSCRQARQCPRCLTIENTTAEHGWTEWRYRDAETCNQDRTCTRCQIKEQNVQHVWDVWKYEAPNSCKQVRFCRRCRTSRETKNPKITDHTWSESQRVNCYLIHHFCQRCGQDETQMLSREKGIHAYGQWERLPNGQQRRTCSECNHVQRT